MREILERLARAEISAAEAERLLRADGIAQIEDFAKLDLNRETRKGIPEVILADGKDPTQVVKIAKRILEAKRRVILSRVSPKHLRALNKLTNPAHSRTSTESGLLILKQQDYKPIKTGGRVGILTAGTSDLPVAEEAKLVAEEMGCQAFIENDVGVAGLHRVFPALKQMLISDVDVIIVAAGREGALPTVVAGLVDLPIIGLPISSGYGLGGRGEAALQSMLQACSLGIAVVNIDGGVAAGAIAALIANRAAKAREKKSRRASK